MVNSIVLLVGLLGSDLQARVENTKKPETGRCWWACADSVLGTNMMGTVQLTGVGRDFGAWPEDIRIVCEVHNVTVSPDLTLAQAERLAPTIPVIANVTWGEECHAIVMLDVQTVRVNRKTTQKRVKYYDSNYPKQTRYMPWSKFASLYQTGHTVEKK